MSLLRLGDAASVKMRSAIPSFLALSPCAKPAEASRAEWTIRGFPEAPLFPSSSLDGD
jgi:hypothetical protein